MASIMTLDELVAELDPWEIRLAPSAFADESSGAPSTDLVHAVADLLQQGPPSFGPGFALIRDLHRWTDAERRNSFQIALTNLVWLEFVRRGWNDVETERTRLNFFQASDGDLPVDLVGSTVTFKRMHFDPHSIFFAHYYEPPVNLSGGELRLVDVRSYLAATALELEEVCVALEDRGNEGRLVVLDEHREAMLERHAVTLAPPGPEQSVLLLVRNDPVLGVAHEISPIASKRPDQPFRRRFVRTSIAPIH
jgi:hypothetical protein